MLSDAWSENAALFKRLMQIYSTITSTILHASMYDSWIPCSLYQRILILNFDESTVRVVY